MASTVGLVMTGGGARGAYQAGVLKRIGELKRVQTEGNPFPIIGGASAGAINGAGLATGATILLLRPNFLQKLGRRSNLPKFFTAVSYRRRKIP